MKNKKIQKVISILVFVALLATRVSFLVPDSLAEDLPPSQPSAPGAPTAPQAPSAPTAPSAPSMPSAPVAPSAPSAPTINSTPLPPPPPPPTLSASGLSVPTAGAAPTLPSTNLSLSSENMAQTASPSTENSPGGSTSANSSESNASPEQGKGAMNTSGNPSVNDPANTATGPFSTSYTAEKLEQQTAILNKNLAELQNKVTALSTTGFNYANFNTLDGKVFSGDTQTGFNLFNKLNSNLTGIGKLAVFNIYNKHSGDVVFNFADGAAANAFASASANVAKNALTGPGSTNIADGSDSFIVKEATGNDAKITNDINLQAVSGGNSASFNTGGGQVTTGNATAIGNIINLTNTNLNVSKWLIGVVNIFGALLGNVVLPQETENTVSNTSFSPATVLIQNSQTGPLSTNQASENSTSMASFDTTNSADIISTVDVSANSGSNLSSANTGGGLVVTGNSDAAVSQSTVANTNTVDEEGYVWMIVVNEMGRWVGRIVGSPWGSTTASNTLPISQSLAGAGQQTYAVSSQNSQTGPMSNNTSSLTSTETTESIATNSAAILNNVTAQADSGHNETSFNTGAGMIETGNAKAGLNLVNMVNTNVVAKKFVAVLVNVLGDWLGQVVPPNSQGQQNVASGNPVQPIAPTPTPSQTAKGGLSVSPTPTPPSENQSLTSSAGTVEQSFTYYYYALEQPVYSPTYHQAVREVTIAREQVRSASRLLSAVPNRERVAQEIQNVTTQARSLKRGLFLSAAFVKATEASQAGMLFGGARLRVNESWLAVVPLALMIVFFRRRKKYDFTKYLNALLEVIL